MPRSTSVMCSDSVRPPIMQSTIDVPLIIHREAVERIFVRRRMSSDALASIRQTAEFAFIVTGPVNADFNGSDPMIQPSRVRELIARTPALAMREYTFRNVTTDAFKRSRLEYVLRKADGAGWILHGFSCARRSSAIPS